MNVYFANGTNIVDAIMNKIVIIFARKRVMSAARKILAKDFLIQMAM